MEIEGVRPDEQPAVLRVKEGILDAFAQPGYAPGGWRRHFVLFFAVGKMPDGGGTVAGGHQQGFVGIDGSTDVRRGQRFALCHKGEREGEGEYLPVSSVAGFGGWCVRGDFMAILTRHCTMRRNTVLKLWGINVGLQKHRACRQ